MNALRNIIFLSVMTVSALAHSADSEIELSPISTEPPQGTCEILLDGPVSSQLAQALQDIRLDDASVDQVIAAMKKSGEVYSEDFEKKLRAQLKLGALFMNQGMMHEAIYQVFKARYGSDDEITDAINSYHLISSKKERSILLSEVIERLLQFVPSVTAENLNESKELAAYLNMSEEEMTAFFERWVYFDEMDQFVEIVVGGINSVLNTHYPDLIQNVLARGGWRYKIARRLHGIEIPERPTENKAANERAVLLYSQTRFEDESLHAYLQKSTLAARRFFILDNANVLTFAQLEWVLANSSDLGLRPQIVQVLRDLKEKRRELTSRNAKYVELMGDLKETEALINRARNIEPYDRGIFQRQINTLLQTEDAKQVLRASVGLIQEYQKKVDSARFVNVVSSVLGASSSRLKNSGSAVLQFVSTVVAAGNFVGLEQDHALKVKTFLTELSNMQSSRSTEVSEMLRTLRIRPPKYLGQPLDVMIATGERLRGEIEAQRKQVEDQFNLVVRRD